MSDDARRLAAISSYGKLQTLSEPDLDGIVRLAARLSEAPVALISLSGVERQWIATADGQEMSDAAGVEAICGHMTTDAPLLVIPDLARDDRARGAFARDYRFYAGAPILDADNLVVGSLCVLDRAPRPGGLGAAAMESLTVLARLTTALLELRRALADSSEALAERLRAAQEAARVGSFVVDIATDLTSVSAEFCRIFGLPEKPAYEGRQLSSLVVDADSALTSTVAGRAEGHGALDVEYRIRRPSDGAVRWISRRSSFERSAHGRPVRLLGTVQDITLRKAEEARQAALLALADELRMAATAEAAILSASRLVGETLAAARAGYAEADGQARLMNVRAAWTDPQARPVTGQYPYDLTPASIVALEQGVTLEISDVAAAESLASDAGLYAAIEVVALLVVPVRDDQKRLGAVFVHDRAVRRWTAGEVQFVGAVAARLQAAVTKLDAEQDQRLLNQELSHRLKNTLAVVQAIADQTLRGRSEPTALDAFAGRLGALGRAHDVLLHQRWSAARMVAIVEAVVGAVAGLDRFVLAGPDLNLAARIVMTLSLLLHELATNALKYGALSAPGGEVEVSWRIDELGANPLFRLRWQEQGGPSVAEPIRRGFGSRLIRAGLVGTGHAEISFKPAGLIAEFRAPLAFVSAG